jgi:hypothetical protein
MTRDEIRSLIGGYATGSLSEAERKALFEAALGDQELFDELAREQALKEVLDGPGVKARLIGALAPRRQRAGWAGAWIWAAAGAFAVAVIAGIVLFERPREVQIAQVTAPPAAPEPPVPAPVVPPPVVSPPPVVPKGAAPDIPAPADKKTAPQPAQAEAAEADALKAEPPPAPAPAPAAPRQTNAPAAVGTLGGVPAGDLAGGGGGGGRGGGRGGAAAGGANRAVAQSFAALAAKPPRLAFDYRLTPEGVLRIEPASAGFLTVAVSDGAGSSTALFLNRPVAAGSVNEIMLPPDAVTAMVIFGPRSATGYGGFVGSPDPPSGTKVDPNPTPDSILTAIVLVKR